MRVKPLEVSKIQGFRGLKVIKFKLIVLNIDISIVPATTDRKTAWVRVLFIFHRIPVPVICLDMTVNVNWHYSNKTELN